MSHQGVVMEVMSQHGGWGHELARDGYESERWSHVSAGVMNELGQGFANWGA